MQLPATEDPHRGAGIGKALPFTEGQVPHVALCKHVGSVVAHAAFVQGHVHGDRDAAIVVNVVEPLAKGVGRRQEETIAHAPVELHLEAVVPGVGAEVGGGIGDAAEGRE